MMGNQCAICHSIFVLLFKIEREIKRTTIPISICIGKQFSYFEQNGEVGTSSICQCRKIQQNLTRESISLEVQVLLLLLDIAISELNIQTKAYSYNL